MDFKKNHFGVDIEGIGTSFSSPAIDSLIETQTRISKLFEPSSGITAMLESPAIRMIQEQQDTLQKLTAPSSALTSFIEQQDKLHMALSSSLIDSISAQQLSFSKAIAASIQVPDMDVISGTLSKFAELVPPEPPMYNLAAEMGKALEACIPKYDLMANALTNALETCMPKFDTIGNMAFRLADSIPQIDSAILSIAQQALGAMDNLTESLQSSMSALLGSLTDIRLPNFDHLANSLNFITDFEEKNELLKSFGWYLISELPEEIVNTIYERRDEITQEEVDILIIQHFRNNKYQALKSIVNSWVSLPYFHSRQIVFHEAQVCHSRRSYNASTTLISLHYEGVVTDFVRERINTPTYRVEKALKCINDLANDLTMDAMPFRDWIVCSYVLECIDKAFTTNFSPADPDSCPNSSRHKIAHGHAVAKETEANSLRRFLFMNELYKLFCCLENEYQLIS